MLKKNNKKIYLQSFFCHFFCLNYRLVLFDIITFISLTINSRWLIIQFITFTNSRR